jgi:hypothetical protein
MSRCLLRLVVVAITICTFVGAGLMQNLPLPTNAASLGMTMMADQGSEDSASMPCHDTSVPPCKDQMPGCMTDFGCVFTVALPALSIRVAGRMEWNPVTYWSAIGPTGGISPEPSVEPPIHFV